MIKIINILLLTLLFSSISNYSQETLKFYWIDNLGLSAIEFADSGMTVSFKEHVLNNIVIIGTPPPLLTSGNWTKYLSVYKGGETMTIECLMCLYGSENFFVKNMIFKSGYYVLTYNPPMYLNEKTGSNNSKIVYTKGEDLEVSEAIKNTRIQYITILDGTTSEWQKVFLDRSFKDFKFIEVDLKDTTSLNLREMTKEEIVEATKRGYGDRK